MSEQNLQPADENPKPQGSVFGKMGAMASKVTSAAKGAVNSAKTGTHNMLQKSRMGKETELKKKIGVYTPEVHTTVMEGLGARGKYLEKFTKKLQEDGAFEKYLSTSIMGKGDNKVNVKWPLPNAKDETGKVNDETGIVLDNNKITKLEHLGGFNSKINVYRKDDDSDKLYKSNVITHLSKVVIDHLIQEIADENERQSNYDVNVEFAQAKADAEAKKMEAKDAEAIAANRASITGNAAQKAALKTFINNRHYLPGVFLTFDRENTPTLYYYDYSKNSSEYETELLDPLFPTEKQGDSIKRVNITKDNTDAIWAILLANQIGEGEDKKDVTTQFDPGFNTTKPTFNGVTFTQNTIEDKVETPAPTTGGDGEAPAAAPSGIENLEKYKATFHSIEKYLRPNHPVEGMTDAERDTMWNIACYASQVGWLDWLEHVNPKPNLIDLLLSEEKMKNAWNNCDWKPNNEKVDNSLKNNWSGFFDKIEFCGYLGSVDSGEIPGSSHVFILQNGLIKVLKDGTSEYKIKTISEPENLKLTFEKKGSMGGKRRRKSHRKSHKKTQKKHKKQMKKSHKKKTRGKKTRGKKC